MLIYCNVCTFLECALTKWPKGHLSNYYQKKAHAHANAQAHAHTPAKIEDKFAIIKPLLVKHPFCLCLRPHLLSFLLLAKVKSSFDLV